MTAYVLVTGEIFRAPELKTGKSGKDYATATIRSTSGTETTYWRWRGGDRTCTPLHRRRPFCTRPTENLERLVAMSVSGERELDLSEYGPAADRVGRLLQRLGLSRTMRNVPSVNRGLDIIMERVGKLAEDEAALREDGADG
jgi:hypothetical protein